MNSTLMEKITLKPVVKELLHKVDGVNTHFDVLAYTGSNSQERSLGSLYVLGYATFEEEDLGYVVSLISSLAKREYYSELSIKGQDPKSAFEHTLKKLNEVLDDFFKNKSLKLNVGLAAIAGDQILLSKLGKFKVGLARSGEYIDVLNNLSLFQKSEEDEQQFSNIISGKLQTGDKLLAYYPSRSITSREKMLQGTFVKEPQNQFVDKIAQLASSTDNFICCGMHIALEHIKEIPIAVPESSSISLAVAPALQVAEVKPVSPPASQAGVGAEMSVAKKPNVVGSLLSAVSRLRGLNRLPAHKRFRGFIVVALAVIIPLTVIALVKNGGGSSATSTALKEATDNLKLVQSKIAENNPQEARSLLYSTLANISALQDKKIAPIRDELQSTLDGMDHSSTVQPALVATLTPEQLTALNGSSVLSFAADGFPSAWHNGLELLSVVDAKTGKAITYKLQDPATAADATLYDGNLYVLSANNIYKYGGALTGGVKRSNWGTEKTDQLISIAGDGNIYGLADKGSIITYFKGERKGVFETGLPIDSTSKIYSQNEGTSLFVFNPATHRLYSLDKTNGALTTTYKLDAIGEIKSMVATPTSDGAGGSVMILSTDGKVWKISIAP